MKQVISHTYQRVLAFFVFLVMLSSACTPLKKESTPTVDVAQRMQQKPLDPQESKALLKDVASNWFYGNGLGSSMLQVGTIVAFPPYAVVAIGNVVLNATGYESIGIGTVLPEESKKKWNDMYDFVTAGPGRFTSAVSGREFVTRDMAGMKLARYVNRPVVDDKTAIPANEQWQVE